MVGPPAMIGNFLRATRVNSGGRDTTNDVAHVLEIPAFERANACRQVGFCLEEPRSGLHSAVGACRVERFVFRVFVDVCSGRYVIRCVLLSVLSIALELFRPRCHDCERVHSDQLVCSEVKCLTQLSFEQEIPALERDYVCDHGSLGWSRCGRHNLCCAKRCY